VKIAFLTFTGEVVLCKLAYLEVTLWTANLLAVQIGHEVVPATLEL